MSTPVIKLWDGILALPLIGTLDSQRNTSCYLRTWLQRIAQLVPPSLVLIVMADQLGTRWARCTRARGARRSCRC